MDPKPEERHEHGPHVHLSPLEAVRGGIPPLRVGDIVLIRHRRSLLRSFVRSVTGGYWDHCGIVVFSKNPAKGYGSNIIAEAVQHGWLETYRRGIEIHKLEKYLFRPDLYDVGIKRFPDLSEELGNRVRAFVLMNVDAPSYRLPLADFFLAWLSRGVRRYVLRRQRFSASGLIQKAFYEAAEWNERHRFAFRELSGDSPIELQELVTPNDIAASDQCVWVWNRQ